MNEKKIYKQTKKICAYRRTRLIRMNRRRVDERDHLREWLSDKASR